LAAAQRLGQKAEHHPEATAALHFPGRDQPHRDCQSVAQPRLQIRHPPGEDQGRHRHPRAEMITGARILNLAVAEWLAAQTKRRAGPSPTRRPIL